MPDPNPRHYFRFLIAIGLLTFFPGGVAAQQNRISGRIAASQRFTLTGHVNPRARAEYDQGRADASLKLQRVTLVLKPSDTQQAALDQLLLEQQDPSSKNYHQWLTPEEYADRFGASQDDINKIVEWLQGQGLTVTNVARARNAVSTSGTAAQMESAFKTEIHLYDVDGETHYANATNPSLPAALNGVALAVHGLNDFRPKRRTRTVTPLGTSGNGPVARYTSSSTGNHYLAPDDFATIFNLKALYNAGIDGTGQKIVVVGQSTIYTSNLTYYRNYFGLPAPNLTTTFVPNTQNPGYSESDAQESDLDLQWASAVAHNASLIFVYSYDVTDAVQYAIDQNLAPVLSMSYGLCEASWGKSDALTLQTWAQQGNAQGITWVASSGDSGAADCYAGTSSSPFGGSSSNGVSLATDLPASLPEVTGVGGTTLTEGSGSYWNSTNDSTSRASALSYIPETAWNDSTSGDPAASGGGASQYFSKPSWQTGAGIPNDSARDVPDVAFPASADHDGYLVYTTSGRSSGLYVFGGTSAGAPTFSGVLALLNQYLVNNGYQSSAGVGNVNSKLYSFAALVPSAFHDITTGDNVITGNSCGTPGCSPTTVSVGYSAGTGYDQVTGLGTIDAFNFVTAWHTGALLTKTNSTVSVAASPGTLTASGSTTITATVSGTSSITPTGTITFSAGSTTLGTSTLSGGSSGTATATLTVSGGAAGLGTGSNTITATYGGDSAFNSATGSATLTIVNASSAAPSISRAQHAASWQYVYAPGMAMAIFGTNLALTTKATSTIPMPTTVDNVSVTINGIAAPLYYVSPTQLNVQIPYETPTSGSAAMVVSNNGQTATINIPMSAAAPGIFIDGNGVLVPTASTARGSTIAMYLTGAGAVSPSVKTAEAPDNGTVPVPTQTTLVTVGGVQVGTTYIGIPGWSVGVLQINFTVDSAVPLGSQPVVVSVGGVKSTAATLTVTAAN